MPVLVVCPGCQRKLKIPDDALGKKVKCPRCSGKFVAQESAAPTPPAVAAVEEAVRPAAAGPVQARAADEDQVAARPPAPRGAAWGGRRFGDDDRRPRPSSGGRVALVVGLAVAAAVLLIGVAVAVLGLGFYAFTTTATVSPVVQADPGAPVNPGPDGKEIDPEAIEAEVRQAGAGVKLAKLDVPVTKDLVLTMDAPAGAQVKASVLDAQVLAGDGFALKIELGKRHLAPKKKDLGEERLFVNTPDLVFAEHRQVGKPRCEFGMTLEHGHLDFCVQNAVFPGDKMLFHSKADCLLMIKCARTLAPKQPLPEDPLAALRQLKADVKRGGDGQVRAVRLDPRLTTDATLRLLKGFADLSELDLGGAGNVTDDGLAHLAGLTGLQKLTLDGTYVTDAGLAHLKGLTRLAEVRVVKTKVTDQGVQDLKAALPRAEVIRSGD